MKGSSFSQSVHFDRTFWMTETRSQCERWGRKEHDLQAQEPLGIDLRKKDDFTYENGDFMEYYDQNWGYLTNENGD